MKYNLKNRPNPWSFNYADINPALKSRDELHKWFEGFEKERRECAFEVEVWVQDIPAKPIPNFPDATESKGHFEKRKAILLNEVLGVSEGEEAKKE